MVVLVAFLQVLVQFVMVLSGQDLYLIQRVWKKS
jgi:hypothetical protein